MDSPLLKSYKQEMARCFSRAKKNGFVAYWEAQRLSDEIYDLLSRFTFEYRKGAPWNDLFQFTIAVYRRWGKTEMDDDGGIMLIMHELDSIWDMLYRMAAPEEKKKMFRFFTLYGSKKSIYDLEENLWDFLDSHFKEKDWIPKKKAYWGKLDAQFAENPAEYRYKRETIQQHLMQLEIDEGMPLEEAEKMLMKLPSYDRIPRLARLYRDRNETEKEEALLEKAMNNKDCFSNWDDFRKRLQEIYRENNNIEKERSMLRALIIRNPGDMDTFKEYKKCFSKEEWAKARDEKLFKSLKNDPRAIPLFAKEKTYDLLMQACERKGDLPSKYEKLLIGQYEERCMNLLIKQTENLAERAYNRKGYQWVASLLRRLRKYDGGKQTIRLAEEFRERYGNKPAFMEELSEFA